MEIIESEYDIRKTISDILFLIENKVGGKDISIFSEIDDSIDILYQDGSVRDIAAASEILDQKALTRKRQKLYVFQLDRLREKG